MKLAQLELEPVAWRLRDPLVTSRGLLSERAGVRLRLSDTDGCTGLGESLPLPASGTETLAASRAALEGAVRRLRSATGELDELLDLADAVCPDAPAARCALDVALHDLAGQRLGRPVARLLCESPLAEVPVNALLEGFDSSALEALRERGYATLKLKLGAEPLERELEWLALLRDAATGLRLRLDPNGAWTRAQARDALARIAPLCIELVEQPVAADDLTGLRWLARGPVALAADEALAHANGRAALVAGELAPLAVIKPMVQGGLRASLQLARAAARAGVNCFVTTTLDGPIGSAAAAHLAAAICDGSLACGLAAAESVEAEFPDWLRPRVGRIRVPELPGLGLAHAP